MTHYRLRLPGPGEPLHSDDGTVAFVAETADEARDCFEDYYGDRPEWVHSHIACGRIAYKHDVDAGDVHEDCEPGDTTFDYTTDHGGELRAHEARVWERGIPEVWWSIHPLPYESVPAEDVPVGTATHHKRLGNGRTVDVPHRRSSGRAFVTVRFGWPIVERERVCSVSAVSFLPTQDWPPRRRQLTVAGEFVAESADEEELKALRDQKLAEHAEDWKREQAKREAA